MLMKTCLRPLERLRDEADFVDDDDIETGLSLDLGGYTESALC